jgi:hypothetical protein
MFRESLRRGLADSAFCLHLILYIALDSANVNSTFHISLFKRSIQTSRLWNISVAWILPGNSQIRIGFERSYFRRSLPFLSRRLLIVSPS